MSFILEVPEPLEIPPKEPIDYKQKVVLPVAMRVAEETIGGRYVIAPDIVDKKYATDICDGQDKNKNRVNVRWRNIRCKNGYAHKCMLDEFTIRWTGHKNNNSEFHKLVLNVPKQSAKFMFYAVTDNFKIFRRWVFIDLEIWKSIMQSEFQNEKPPRCVIKPINDQPGGELLIFNYRDFPSEMIIRASDLPWVKKAQ